MPSPLKNVGILFGGRSVEHEISILTALEAAEAMDVTRFRPTLVYIDLRGRWWTGRPLRDAQFYRGFHDRPDDVPDDLEQVVLPPMPDVGGLVRIPRAGGPAGALRRFLTGRRRPEDLLPIDVWLPLLHGTNGEDGRLQGLLELTGTPYTGCDVRAAAVGMSKPLTKTIAQANGVSVLPWQVVSVEEFRGRDPDATVRALLEEASGPLIVKPANLGSSVAVSRADSRADLIAGLVRVFQHDLEAIIEPCVVDLAEINVAVRRIDGVPRPSLVEMPVRRSESGLLTYEDKYAGSGAKKGAQSRGLTSMVRVTDPPDLPDRFKREATDAACTVYEALGCAGVARIDFILDEASGELWFNEINTLPGALAHYLWTTTTTYTDLLSDLIVEAEERGRLRAAASFEFGFKVMR
jgi:D-alanine-D-alanine ligase